ncbi:MAG: lipopolysaccharide assembly protein LapA domain-containing protein, partial [Pseudomonadales bacterium]
PFASYHIPVAQLGKWTGQSNNIVQSIQMLKKIAVLLVFVVILISMLVFTRLNPGFINVDLAFAAVETSIPLAFTVTFILGWLFGLLCTVLFVVRLLNERRQLRRALRLSEAEVSGLRSLPISDAD